ncbi:hypothetical protein EB796_024658 [Bugula neritina]|uniref:Carboxylesterase type B domain-containing protein n=1 Tax=Bugula neritina TaxID=10212 RepID=A0A7J7ITZ9_BUGNE|nr:hypothetical protein EB796_024658 [Bugula neritina]
MVGFNGQEGLVIYAFETALVAQALNKSIFEHGVDMEVVRESLRIKCLTHTYKIDETDDDRERAVRLVAFLDVSISDEFAVKFLGGIGENEKPLSLTMMTMWTNFAKSGNPNYPVALPEGTPTWPEFTADTNQFLELNSKTMKVITTPNKERLDKLTGSLQQSVKLQRDADQRSVSTAKCEAKENTARKDEL